MTMTFRSVKDNQIVHGVRYLSKLHSDVCGHVAVRKEVNAPKEGIPIQRIHD